MRMIHGSAHVAAVLLLLLLKMPARAEMQLAAERPAPQTVTQDSPRATPGGDTFTVPQAGPLKPALPQRRCKLPSPILTSLFLTFTQRTPPPPSLAPGLRIGRT